jgi:pilus assembly protein CpaB
MVLLALAIGCGLVAAFLTAKLGASGGSKTEMVPVLVAAKNLDQGTKLDDPDKVFVRKPFPKESVPPEFIDDLSQMKGKVLTRTVRAGTHVTVADFAGKTSIDLPIGEDGTPYKGMAIKVSQHTAVSGFIQPGDRVDVMVVEHMQNGKTATTLLMENVLVVAINEIAVKPEGQGGAIKNTNTVTLAVKQKDGLILSLAQAKGEISLMLRSKDDVTKKGRNSSRTIDSFDRPDEPAAGVTANAPELAKVPVARKDLPPGTRITDPTELFEEREVPEAVLNEAVVRDMNELKDKIVTKYAYAGLLVPKAAFEGELPKAPTGPAPAGPVYVMPKTHTMTIQVGVSAPQYVKYDDKGKLIDVTQPIAPVIATPAPEKSTTGSPEIKPEKDD